MAEQGTVVVRAYTSRAQIPVTGATVAVTHPSAGGKHLLVALRVTDESGHTPVSYTHLDVYKRQMYRCRCRRSAVSFSCVLTPNIDLPQA